MWDLTLLKNTSPQFLQRGFCFSNTCSHPVVFLERPGGMRVISTVTTVLSPIHYAGHQGPAKRFREATHHLTHVIPVHLERIPGQRASTVTLEYDHNILKWAVKMSPDTCCSVFSKLTAVLSLWIYWRRYLQEVNTFPYLSLLLHGLWLQMMAIVFVIADAFWIAPSSTGSP